MSTNSSSNQHLSHDGSFNGNEGSFLERAQYTGYDRDNLDQSWNFAPGRIEDSSMHLYQGWPTTDHHDNYNLQRNATPHNKSDFYGSVFTGASGDFHNIQYGTSSMFSPSTQSPYVSNVADASSLMDVSYQMPHSVFSNSPLNPATISPGALQQNANQEQAEQIQLFDETSENKSATWPEMPIGTPSGKFVITSRESLAQIAKCRRLHSFVDVIDETYDVTITKTTIPAYIPRKSRNEIKRILATDDRYSATVAKKPSKRGKNAAPKSAPVAAPAVSSPVLTLAKVPDVKPVKVSESSSEAGSSDGESDSQSDEETMSAPLPLVRPSNPIEAVKYDTVKKIWRVPYRSATVEDIRKGLADFWEIVRTIRDRWKSDSAAVKQAEETKKTNEIPFLKDRVSDQRNMLEAVLQAALKDGHKDIVEHFGENLQFVLALAQFLQDRVREMDYNSSFTKTVLELLSRCKTLTDGNLDKTGVGKVLPRLSKRGDDSVKSLAKRITDNASAASKKRKENAKSGASAVVQSKDSKTVLESATQKMVSPVTGVKRARTSEGTAVQPAKKLAAETRNGKDDSPKPLTAAKKLTPIAETKVVVASSGPTAIKTKAHQVIAKPSGFFSSLQPASKKSNTATTTSLLGAAAAKAAAQSTTDKKPASAPAPAPTPAPAPAQAKPAFSFAATIASLNKPKELEPTAKPEEKELSETPEERQKRLRKEERRKLRVTFKPDSSLVEIKYFMHDPDEELGHDASQVRDVGDVESEGRMFKLKHQEGGDMVDLDESDEDEQMVDAYSISDMTTPFPTASMINFEDVPNDERERMYAPYGGGVLKPDCPEKWIQEHREQNTLSAIYTDPSDIPPSPKEPMVDETDNADPIKNFGEPPEHILSRLEVAKKSQSKEIPTKTATPMSSSQLSALLSVIPQAGIQAQQQPSVPQPPADSDPSTLSQSFSDLEKIFAQYAQTPAQNQQPPPPPPPPQPVPIIPQQQQPAPINAFAGLQNFFGVPHAVQSQQPPIATPAAIPATATPDLSSILASLQQAAGSGQMPFIQKTNKNVMPDLSKLSLPGFPQLGQQLAQQMAQHQQPQLQQQPQPSYPYENEERRRWRESGGENDDSDAHDSSSNKNKRRQWGNNNSNNNTSNKRNKFNNDGRNSPPKFVVQCKYWKDGKCKKGDACTFRHDG